MLNATAHERHVMARANFATRNQSQLTCKTRTLSKNDSDYW
jgi:hypothetical protein